MYLHFETDAALLGVVFVAERILDGLDTRTRRTEHHGATARTGVLGVEQVAVDRLPAGVQPELHQVAIHLVRTIFRSQLLGIGQGESGRLGLLLLPKRLEVGRHLRVGTDILGREAHLHVVAIGLAAHTGHQTAITEAGRIHRTHVDNGSAVLQHHAALRIGRHQIASKFILHRHAVLRNAIPVELHLYTSLLARPVGPVGMVGHGDPQHVTPIRIILGQQGQKGAEPHYKKQPSLLHLYFYL